MTRRRAGDLALKLSGLAAVGLGLGVLFVLVADVVIDGAGRLSWSFLTSYPSRHASVAGILPALAGSLFVVSLAIAIAVPLGVAAGLRGSAGGEGASGR